VSPKPAGSEICAFVALELPQALQAAFTEEILRLKKAIAGVQWIDPRRMHLTLRYLGWTSGGPLKALESHLAAAARACPPIDAKVSGLGTFPPSGRARVLWAGIDLPQPAAILQGACEAAAIQCGFPPERRAFQGHLTLGRWKKPARRRDLPDLVLGATRLERLVLFRSGPPQGGVAVAGAPRVVAPYEKLAVFPLG
jgi:2'-5' RNA ligase